MILAIVVWKVKFRRIYPWKRMSEKSSEERFTLALEKGTCDVVDAMLEEGYVPKPKDITIACRNGDIAMFDRLVKYPMDLQEGLFEAIKFKQIHMLDRLYVAGVDINEPDRHNRNGLHYVKDAQTCRWLLDMGVEQILDDCEITPLLIACCGNYEDVVDVLLQTGQGREIITQADDNLETPLFRACYNGNCDLVEKLLSYPEARETINKCEDEGNTPLHIACMNNSADMVKLLLTYPEGLNSLNQCNKKGNFPLSWARWNKNEEIITTILAHKEGRKSLNIKNRGATVYGMANDEIREVIRNCVREFGQINDDLTYTEYEKSE